MSTATKPSWMRYQVDVPCGTSGVWRVEKHTVTETEARLSAIRAHFGRYTPAGTYTGLKRGGTLVMSDTPDEIRDLYEPIRFASGHCLINGLGLGVLVNGLFLNPNVARVTVIEKSPDVISLVAPHWQSRHGDRLEVIHECCFAYKPPKGVRYGMVWHDIWDHICADNLGEMKDLHRKYGRRCERQGSWCRDLCERHASRSRI